MTEKDVGGCLAVFTMITAFSVLGGVLSFFLICASVVFPNQIDAQWIHDGLESAKTSPNDHPIGRLLELVLFSIVVGMQCMLITAYWLAIAAAGLIGVCVVMVLVEKLADDGLLASG